MLASIGGLPAIMQDRVRIHGRASAEVIDPRERKLMLHNGRSSTRTLRTHSTRPAIRPATTTNFAATGLVRHLLRRPYRARPDEPPITRGANGNPTSQRSVT